MPADALALTRAILLNKTSAGTRVSTDLPAFRQLPDGSWVLKEFPTLPAFPYVTFERTGGGRSRNDLRRGEPRMQVNAWAASPGITNPASTVRAQAYKLALEIEAVFLPNIVKGFHGEVMVGGVSVYVWDVVQEVGPTWLPDPDTGLARFFAYYVLKHD